MSKQLSDAPLRPDERQADSGTTSPSSGSIPAIKKKQRAIFWPWFGGLLIVGLVIAASVTYAFWNWFNNVQLGQNTAAPTPPITSLKVQRTISYADLTVTVLNLQYATFFTNDQIHPGQAMVRLNMTVANPTQTTVNIAYYDVTRLLLDKQQIAPTNLTFAGSVLSGKTLSGWMDFPVAKSTSLNALKLRFGNPALNETLVTLPMTGNYDANQYANHLYNVSIDPIYYYFKDFHQPVGYTLTYHITGVDLRYSYHGKEASDGQQFYVINVSVDNPNGADVAPGTGYDYLRLRINDTNVYPVDSTLPDNFKAQSQGTTGSVIYSAGAGMHSLDVLFLTQSVSGWSSYWVTY